MTHEQARDVLHARFDGQPWFRQVILGVHDSSPVLYLMVASHNDLNRWGIPFLFEGYPVLVRVDQPMRFAGQCQYGDGT